MANLPITPNNGASSFSKSANSPLQVLNGERFWYETLQVWVYAETITPEKAEALLKFNEGNRKVSRTNAGIIAEQIKRGDFQFNGETIVFDDSGVLINGQHRCHAVVQSKQPIQSLVVCGVSSEAFATYDGGKSRSASDVLSIAGYDPKYSSTVAKAAHFVLSFKNAYYADAVHCSTRIYQSDSTANRGKQAAVSDRFEILRFVQETDGFFDFIAESQKLHRSGKRLLPARIFNALYWLCHQKNAAHADKFFSKMATGIGVAANSPELALQNILYQEKISEKSTLSPRYILAITIKAFNKSLKGEKVKRLSFTAAENFPKIEG